MKFNGILHYLWRAVDLKVVEVVVPEVSTLLMR